MPDQVYTDPATGRRVRIISDRPLTQAEIDAQLGLTKKRIDEGVESQNYDNLGIRVYVGGQGVSNPSAPRMPTPKLAEATGQGDLRAYERDQKEKSAAASLAPTLAQALSGVPLKSYRPVQSKPVVPPSEVIAAPKKPSESMGGYRSRLQYQSAGPDEKKAVDNITAVGDSMLGGGAQGLVEGLDITGGALKLMALGPNSGVDPLELVRRASNLAYGLTVPYGGQIAAGGEALQKGGVGAVLPAMGKSFQEGWDADPIGMSLQGLGVLGGGAHLVNKHYGAAIRTAAAPHIARAAAMSAAAPRPHELFNFPSLADVTNPANWSVTPAMGATGGMVPKFNKPPRVDERATLPPLLNDYGIQVANKAAADAALRQKRKSLASLQVPDLLPMLDPKTNEPRRGSFFMTDQSHNNHDYQSIYGAANTTPTFTIGGGAGWANPQHMGGSGTSWAARGLSAFNTGHKLFDMYDKTGWMRAMGPDSIDGSPDFLRAAMLVETPHALDIGQVTPDEVRRAIDVMAAMKPPGDIPQNLYYLSNMITDIASAKEAIAQAFQLISTTPSKGADSFAFRKRLVVAMEMAQQPGAKSGQNISQAAVDAFKNFPSISQVRTNMRDPRFINGTWKPNDIVGVLSGGVNPLGPDGKPVTVPAPGAPATTPYGYAYAAVPDRPTGTFPGGIPGLSETVRNQIVQWRKSQGRDVLPQDVTENDVAQFYRLQSYSNVKTIQPTVQDLIGAGVPIAGRSARQTVLLDHAVNGRVDTADPTAMHQAMAANTKATGLTQYATPQELAAVGDLHKLRDSDTYWAITHPQKPWYQEMFPDFFGENERELVSVFNNDPDMAGLTNGAVMLHAIKNGVTALDAFALPTAKYPNGVLPSLYKRYGWQEVGRIPFDPSFYTPEKLAALESEFGVSGWVKQTDPTTGRVTNYPDVAVMKWSGDDATRASNRRNYIFGDPASVVGRSIEGIIGDAEGGSSQLDRTTAQAGRPGLGDGGVDAAAQGSAGGGVVGSSGRPALDQSGNPLTPRDTRFVEGAQEVLGLPANVREALGLPAVGELVKANKPSGAALAEAVAAIDFISPEASAQILGSKEAPAYLAGVAEFMVRQRDRLVKGTLRASDLAKAILMTSGSQGAGEISAATVTAKTGLTIGDLFTSTGASGDRMIRPEEAVAAWIMSREGKRALANLDKGKFDLADWAGVVDVRKAFGDDRFKTNNLFGTPTKGAYNLTNVHDLARQVNELGKAGDFDGLNTLLLKTNSVGEGKIGFFRHFLGMGDRTAVDAMQVNSHLTGAGDIAGDASPQAQVARTLAGDATFTAGMKAKIEERFAQLRAEGIGKDIPADVFNHIMHHWWWDRVKGLETTHKGLYAAMDMGHPKPGSKTPGGQLFALGNVSPDLFSILKDRWNSDYHAGHSLSSPLSINDGAGATIRPGSYERIGGRAGKQASDILRELQSAVDGGSRPDIALQRAKYAMRDLESTLADKPGLLEEIKRHVQAIENDYYHQASKLENSKKLDESLRQRGTDIKEGLAPQVKPYEKSVGNLVSAVTGGKVPDADFWLRSQVDRMASLNNLLKLKYNVKSSAINLAQPLETLWPRVSTADYAKMLAESLKPSNRKRLEDLGVIDGPTKLEGETRAPLDRGLASEIENDPELMKLASEIEADWAIKESEGVQFPEKEGPTRVKKTLGERLKSASPFSSASEQNRILGYLYGEMDAKKRGITDPDQVHQNGLTWAEVVEFDNSTFNAPPMMRDTAAKLLGQYKGFTVKSIENLADLVGAPGTPAQKSARVAKWATAKGLQGGAKVLTAPFGIAGLTVYVTARQMFRDRGMSEDEAQKAAELVYLGLPSLMGADISGSVAMLDEPFGDTTQEQFLNFMGGPTLSSALSYGQMVRDKKPALDIAARVSPYIKSGIAISDAVTGNNKPVMVPKTKENKQGSRPPTLGEAALRVVATPLSAQSGAMADREILDGLHEKLADLDFQLVMRKPKVQAMDRYEQDKLRKDSLRSVKSDFPTIESAQKALIKYRAKLGREVPAFGLGGSLPTPNPGG